MYALYEWIFLQNIGMIEFFTLDLLKNFNLNRNMKMVWYVNREYTRHTMFICTVGNTIVNHWQDNVILVVCDVSLTLLDFDF